MNQPFVTTGIGQRSSRVRIVVAVTEQKLAGIANTPYTFKQGLRVKNSDMFL